MEKFGFLIPSFGPNQLSYSLVKSANELLEQRDDIDIAGFYHDLSPYSINPCFSTANMFECFSYVGRLVTFTLNSSSRSLEWIGPSHLYFFPADLEWTKNSQAGFEQLSQIYCNKKLPIIARSENFKSIFELTFGSNVIGVVNDFNFGELVKVILDYEKNIK
jgi:hypothetical protein